MNVYTSKNEKLIHTQRGVIEKQQKAIDMLEEENSLLKEQLYKYNYKNLYKCINTLESVYKRYENLIKELEECKKEYTKLNKNCKK